MGAARHGAVPELPDVVHDYPPRRAGAGAASSASPAVPLDSSAPHRERRARAATPAAAGAVPAAGPPSPPRSWRRRLQRRTAHGRRPRRSVHVRHRRARRRGQPGGRRAQARGSARLSGRPRTRPNVPVRLLNDDPPIRCSWCRAGLRARNGEPAPTHLALYSSDARELRARARQDELMLPLTWTDGQGVKVTKTLTFHRGRYDDRSRLLRSTTRRGAPWSFAPYAQILRYNTPVERSYFRPDSYAFKGPAIYDGTQVPEARYARRTPKLDQSVQRRLAGSAAARFRGRGGAASRAATIAISCRPRAIEFLLKAPGPTQQVAAGRPARRRSETLFVGPEDAVAARRGASAARPGHRLRHAAHRSPTPLFWLLNHVHSLVGNWGFAIIIVTLLLKLLFYPLAEASGSRWRR